MKTFLSVSESLNAVELKDVSSKKKVQLNPSVTGGEYITIDANFWLPLAAPIYNISPSLRDYVMVPVPIMISDFPNTNGDSVTKSDLLVFNPEYGMPAYKTFKAKPTHVEHDNHDHTKAKGVILDVYLKPLKGYGGDKHIKMVQLLAFDRTRDPVLCNNILEKRISTYSMGMYYTSYTCSVCGHTVSKANQNNICMHTKLRKPTYRMDNGKLAYRYCHNIVGFECSAVADPAFAICQSDIILHNGETERMIL